MRVGLYNGRWALTRGIYRYGLSSHYDLNELINDSGINDVDFLGLQPIRLWLGTYWSTNTYKGFDFQHIRYDEIPENVLQQWKKLDEGDIVYTVHPTVIDRTAVHVENSNERVVKILQSYHLDTHSLYRVAILSYTGLEKDSYHWQPLSITIKYIDITNRNPEFTDSQYMKIMEANLRI